MPNWLKICPLRVWLTNNARIKPTIATIETTRAPDAPLSRVVSNWVCKSDDLIMCPGGLIVGLWIPLKNNVEPRGENHNDGNQMSQTTYVFDTYYYVTGNE